MPPCLWNIEQYFSSNINAQDIYPYVQSNFKLMCDYKSNVILNPDCTLEGPIKFRSNQLLMPGDFHQCHLNTSNVNTPVFTKSTNACKLTKLQPILNIIQGFSVEPWRFKDSNIKHVTFASCLFWTMFEAARDVFLVQFFKSCYTMYYMPTQAHCI